MDNDKYEMLLATKNKVEAEKVLYQTRMHIWELIEQYSQQEINQERFDDFIKRLKTAIRE